jgi:DNA-binding NarL/FixJ family response regulator
MYKIKLLLVEDNRIVRDGIKELLGNQPDMEVCNDVSGGVEALNLLALGLRPDIILSDMNMRGIDGIELTRQIVALGLPNVKIIILTMHAKEAFVKKAFEAGAKGYLLKDGDFQELYKAIRLIYNGSLYSSIGITS